VDRYRDAFQDVGISWQDELATHGDTLDYHLSAERQNELIGLLPVIGVALTEYAWHLVNHVGEAFTEENLAIMLPTEEDELMAMGMAEW
jgi:hypothetical protein